MKKRTVRSISLLLTCLILLSACASTEVMQLKDGKYFRKSNGVAYLPAEEYYRAGTLSETAVARIKGADGKEIPLYPVKGFEEDRLLADSEGYVYCAEGNTLPKFSEMEFSSVLLGETDFQFVTLSEIEDESILRTLTDAYRSGVSFPASEVLLDPVKQYDLRFVIKDSSLQFALSYRMFDSDVLVYQLIEDKNDYENLYPGIPVSVSEEAGELLAVYHFGKGLMFDRSQKTYYAVGEILNDYFGE